MYICVCVDDSGRMQATSNNNNDKKHKQTRYWLTQNSTNTRNKPNTHLTPRTSLLVVAVTVGDMGFLRAMTKRQRAWMALATSIVFSTGMIAFVHLNQNKEREVRTQLHMREQGAGHMRRGLDGWHRWVRSWTGRHWSPLPSTHT